METGTAHGTHLDVHQPLRGVLNKLPQETGVIALGYHRWKVNHGLGHRALLRCRRSSNNPQTTKTRGGRQPGLLHPGVGHYPSGEFYFGTSGESSVGVDSNRADFHISGDLGEQFRQHGRIAEAATVHWLFRTRGNRQ